MFDYLKMTKLVPTMCDSQRIKYAKNLTLPPNVDSYLTNRDIQYQGCINFYKEEDIRIFIVYGKSDYLMMHDIIDNKYTFCIFADYIIKDENTYSDMFKMLMDIMEYIFSYAFPGIHKVSPKYIKDTFLDSLDEQMRQICAYNIWSIGGDRFLDEYKAMFLEDAKDIEKVMQIIDRM
jgi:hypothetical protein